jgi:hypothetical protein
MTLESSVITNWPDASRMIGIHLRNAGGRYPAWGSVNLRVRN